MSLTNEFYLYFTLDPQIMNFFWVQILQGFSLGFMEPASLDHSDMFGIQLGLFSNDFLLDFSFVVSCSDTLKVLLCILLPPLLHLLLYLLFVCFFIPSIALSTFLFVFQTPPLVKQILLGLVFWFFLVFLQLNFSTIFCFPWAW